MPPTLGGDERVPTHVVYDKSTGRILGRFRRYDVAAGRYCECDPDEVAALFRDDRAVLSRVTDGDVGNLAVLTATLPGGARLGDLAVSAGRRVLVRRPRLWLRTDRDVLEGDGEDTVTVSVDAVDDQGRVLRDFRGEIQVTTTRGKLSARGGRVAVEHGQGRLDLTSVRETVERVLVRAVAPDGSAAPGELVLRFA